MKYFNCDYNEGAYPGILRRLAQTNFEQTPGYGEDEHCAEAARMIKTMCGGGNIDVHFLVGGTQVNLTVLSAALRPHQGAISADTGHINVHESGAIEATGHKVLAISTKDGKLSGEMVRQMCKLHYDDEAHEHIVMPGAVYISNPTQLGNIYTRAEIQDIRNACDSYGLYLYLDGARLGYGLTAADNDLDLPFLARMCDAFYIGGTKQGALFGEALVIRNENLKRDFRYLIKQKGGMLAKGRLLGIQFEELFRDGAYFKLAGRANRLADILRGALRSKGYEFAVDSSTNQIFVEMPEYDVSKLKGKYAFANMGMQPSGKLLVRFCTSWATRSEDVADLAGDILQL